MPRTYTSEQVRRIVAGLATGKPPEHRPMSAHEFKERYDPETARQEQQLRVLEDIRDDLRAQRS